MNSTDATTARALIAATHFAAALVLVPVLAVAVAVAVALALALALALAVQDPVRHGKQTGRKPRRGGAQDARRFSTAHGCAAEKCPVCLRTRSAQRGGRAARVCFLLVTFLCTSKEK
ncbi:hypothetical protein RAB70_19750 [Xanthomonas sontii]|uniref:hypothetical protein n=1 Tax=Xanthomonas sontii TaxID=2650745 RepID=UPI0014783108|nr:hypothetical protein [Xanthomonas sontii]MDQ7758144.1 hypothetical protein [Xanthomonas sontii]UZK08189.1 hypothetical protein CJ027_016490 [Xanthomonas sontii]